MLTFLQNVKNSVFVCRSTMFKFALISAFLLSISVLTAGAATVVVDADGFGSVADCNDGATPAGSNTISGGIALAGAADTVKVCPGLYVENVTLNKSIFLIGAQFGVDARGRIATETIIAPASGTGITLVTGSAGATVDGFTISGGARGIESGSGPLDNLTIANNRVIGFTGNGIFLNDPGIDVNISQNVIDGTSKTGGGGLMHFDTDAFHGLRFQNNNIIGKGATDTSTGLFVDGNHNVGVSVTPRTPAISGNLVNNCQTGMNLGSRAFTGGAISGNTFSNNLGDGVQGGIQLTAITGNSFNGNGRHGLALTSFGNTGADRGAQNSTITGNLMSGNGFAQNGAGISFSATQAAGTISTNQAHFNRIVGNNFGTVYSGTETINIDNNWWGCSFGPGTTGTGCPVAPNTKGGTSPANMTSTPYLTLTTSASPNFISVSSNSTVTSKLTINSAATDTSGSGNVPNGTPATFVGTLGSVVSPGTTTAGVATTVFTAGIVTGAGGVDTTIDGQTVNAPITIYTCPAVSVSTTLTSKTTYPSLTGVPVSIPVDTTSVTGLGVIGADFTFTYDQTKLDPTPANISVTAGSVSPLAVITYNANTPGQVVVSVVDGLGTFSGAGTVANLHFRTIGPVGTTSALGLVNFRYNNTLVCSSSTDGLLTIVSGTLSGNVNYTNALAPGPHPQTPNGPRGVNDVTVSAAGSPNVSGNTNTSGNYALNNFGTGSYTVTAAHAPYIGGTSNPYNGIFSNDSTLISRHVVGLITLSPTQIAAGKVSGLSTLSSFDAALIAQWIVGVPNVINQTGQWKITPASTVIPDMTLDQTLNFNALLMGDVNGDYDPLGLRPAPVLTDVDRIREAVKVTAVDSEARAGSVVTVPVRLDNLGGKQVSSYEFDVRFDADVLSPAKVAADIAGTMSAGQTIAVNSPERGLLKVVVFSAFPAGGEGVFVDLRFVVNGSVGTSSPVTIERFRFNDGLDDTFVTSGVVRVVKGSSVIRNQSTDIDQ